MTIVKLLALCASLTTASAFVIIPTPKAFKSKERATALNDAKSDFWDMGPVPTTLVQGGALRTWTLPESDQVHLALESLGPSEGNPLKCTVSLKTGPVNTPHKIDVYSGKGSYRTFKCIIMCPGLETNTLFVRNENPVEYDCEARVATDVQDKYMYDMSPAARVEGGAVRTFTLPPDVNFAKVILTSNGRPIYAMVELVQAPNAPKYTLDIYSEDGDIRPFCTVLETPGAGNQVRIVNTAGQEFPFSASVGPSVPISSGASSMVEAPGAPGSIGG